MNARRDQGAMPWDHNAIRVRFDDDEPHALVFHEQALPGALVSWAWSQLMALNALLDAILEARREDPDGSSFAAAVQNVLLPVINALAFSEQRAHQLRSEPGAQPNAQGKKSKPRKGKKATRA